MNRLAEKTVSPIVPPITLLRNSTGQWVVSSLSQELHHRPIRELEADNEEFKFSASFTEVPNVEVPITTHPNDNDNQPQQKVIPHNQQRENNSETKEEIDVDELLDHRQENFAHDALQQQFQVSQATVTHEFDPNFGYIIDYGPELIEGVIYCPTYSTTIYPSPAVKPFSDDSTVGATSAFETFRRLSNEESNPSLDGNVPTVAFEKEGSVARSEPGPTEDGAQKGNAIQMETVKLDKKKEPRLSSQSMVKKKGQTRVPKKRKERRHTVTANQDDPIAEMDNQRMLSGPRKRWKQSKSFKVTLDPSAPTLQLDSREEHLISACPHHGTLVLLSRPLTEQSSTYCSPNCIRLHVASFFTNWTSGFLRSHLLINSATNAQVKFTGIRRQFEEMIESNQMLKLLKYVQFRSRSTGRMTPKMPKKVKVAKKQMTPVRSREGTSGKERGTPTSVWKPLRSVQRRKGVKCDVKAEKSHHKYVKMGNLVAGRKTPTAAMSKLLETAKKNVPVNEGASTSQAISDSFVRTSPTVGPVRSPPPTVHQAGVYSRISSSSSSFTVGGHLPTKKSSIKATCGDSLRTNQAPPEPTRTVNSEPNQEATRTASALVACPGEPPSRTQLTWTQNRHVPQSALLHVLPASQRNLWQGFIEKATGEQATFPVLAYPLTVNATPHWFEDSGFVSNEPPCTKRLLMFGSKREKMLSLLQGDFELAVVDFALPSGASQLDRSKAEETFHYLIGKVGYCYKKGDSYLTHLFVYPLGREEQLPGLLQGVIALQCKRSGNMLLGLLVRKGSNQTHPPAVEMRRPVEEKTPVRPKTKRVSFAFPSYLPNGDIDERIKMNRTETSRRDTRLDPRPSARAAVVTQTRLPRPFQPTPSTSNAARLLGWNRVHHPSIQPDNWHFQWNQ